MLIYCKRRVSAVYVDPTHAPFSPFRRIPEHLPTMLSSLSSSLLAVGFLGASWSQAAPASYNAGVGAIYTLANNAQNASIIAMSISENGTLFGSPVSTPTGGKGLSGVTRPGEPNVGSLFGSNAICAQDNVPIHFRL